MSWLCPSFLLAAETVAYLISKTRGSDSGNAFPARNNVASGTSAGPIDLRKLLMSTIFSFLLEVASTL